MVLIIFKMVLVIDKDKHYLNWKKRIPVQKTCHPLSSTASCHPIFWIAIRKTSYLQQDRSTLTSSDHFFFRLFFPADPKPSSPSCPAFSLLLVDACSVSVCILFDEEMREIDEVLQLLAGTLDEPRLRADNFFPSWGTYRKSTTRVFNVLLARG